MLTLEYVLIKILTETVECLTRVCNIRNIYRHPRPCWTYMKELYTKTVNVF